MRTCHPIFVAAIAGPASVAFAGTVVFQDDFSTQPSAGVADVGTWQDVQSSTANTDEPAQQRFFSAPNTNDDFLPSQPTNDPFLQVVNFQQPDNPNIAVGGTARFTADATAGDQASGSAGVITFLFRDNTGGLANASPALNDLSLDLVEGTTAVAGYSVASGFNQFAVRYENDGDDQFDDALTDSGERLLTWTYNASALPTFDSDGGVIQAGTWTLEDEGAPGSNLPKTTILSGNIAVGSAVDGLRFSLGQGQSGFPNFYFDNLLVESLDLVPIPEPLAAGAFLPMLIIAARRRRG
ncbi:MAG: hypothetical protein AAF561_12760 [Planctomycetota bacterium]